MEKKKGRPPKSKARQNIIEIINIYGPMHGYEISKIYNDIYTPVTLRLIHYHLKKGVAYGEFSIKEVEQKPGEYSWGQTTQRIIYALGPNAKPIMDKRVKKHKDSKKNS